jgi:hypothetical protein
MKKIITWLIAGIVAGLVGGYLIQSCRDAPLKKENAQLKADIAPMKVAQTELEASSAAQISALLENIGTLQGNIDSLMTVNADLETDLENSRQDAAALEAQAGILMAEVQPAIDANPKLKVFVGNLLAQIANGKDQIFTLTKQVETWKGAFISSEGKYQAQLKISDNYKVLWEGENALRLKVEQRLAIQDLRIVSLENKFRLIGIGGIAVAAVAVVLLVSHR